MFRMWVRRILARAASAVPSGNCADLRVGDRGRAVAGLFALRRDEWVDAAFTVRGDAVIAVLLAYLREGWRIDGIRRWEGRDCWRLVDEKHFAPEFVPLPIGWVKPQ